MDSELNIVSQLKNLSVEQKRLLRLKLGQKTLSGHQIIAQSLKDNGITHIYSLSGTPIDLTLSLCAELGIRIMAVRHQQSAVVMAAAQNYLEGKLTAVVILSAGPAVTNAITGALVAQDNCFPLLIIGSRRAIQKKAVEDFQALDAIPLFKSITKSSKLVESTADISNCLNQGISATMNNRPGVVYLEVPEDVLGKTASVKLLPVTAHSNAKEYEPAALQQAVTLINQAKRPMIILGRGGRWNDAYKELDYLINDLGIPFTTSPMARGYFPDTHSRCFNSIQSELISTADLILVVGAKLNWTFRFGAEFSPEAKVIQIDIHPTDEEQSVSATVAIQGDARDVLLDMNAKLQTVKLDISDSWIDSLNQQRHNKKHHWETLANDSSLPISPYYLIKEIRSVIPEDAIVAIDGNVILAIAQKLLPSNLPVSRLTSGTNGCIGTGIPFGIAAKVAYPQRPVIIITGDTALGFNAMEMETAIRLRLPVIVIVANNDGNNGSLKQKKFYASDYPDQVTMFQKDIHYEKIMQAFGGQTFYVEKPEQIQTALSQALVSEKACCINVKINSETQYPND